MSATDMRPSCLTCLANAAAKAKNESHLRASGIDHLADAGLRRQVRQLMAELAGCR